MCSDSNSKRLYRRTAEWALETFWINVTNSSSLFIPRRRRYIYTHRVQEHAQSSPCGDSEVLLELSSRASLLLRRRLNRLPPRLRGNLQTCASPSGRTSTYVKAKMQTLPLDFSTSTSPCVFSKSEGSRLKSSRACTRRNLWTL